jgi:hypothetical protein
MSLLEKMGPLTPEEVAKGVRSVHAFVWNRLLNPEADATTKVTMDF